MLVAPNPRKNPLSANVKLVLVSEDPRAREEKDRVLQRAAEQRTHQMFGSSGLDNGAELKGE